MEYVFFDCQEGCLQPDWQPCPVSTDGEHIWVAPNNLSDIGTSPGHAHCEACGSPDWSWICLEDGCSCKCHDDYYESFLPLVELLQMNMEGSGEWSPTSLENWTGTSEG